MKQTLHNIPKVLALTLAVIAMLPIAKSWNDMAATVQYGFMEIIQIIDTE